MGDGGGHGGSRPRFGRLRRLDGGATQTVGPVSTSGSRRTHKAEEGRLWGPREARPRRRWRSGEKYPRWTVADTTMQPYLHTIDSTTGWGRQGGSRRSSRRGLVDNGAVVSARELIGVGAAMAARFLRSADERGKEEGMEGCRGQQQHAGSLSPPARSRVGAELEHGGHAAPRPCARSTTRLTAAD
jgi:hypothetical protein